MFSILWLQYKIFNSMQLLGPVIYFLSSLQIKLASFIVSLQCQTLHIFMSTFAIMRITEFCKCRNVSSILHDKAWKPICSLFARIFFMRQEHVLSTLDLQEHMLSTLDLQKNSLVHCNHRSSPWCKYL